MINLFTFKNEKYLGSFTRFFNIQSIELRENT